MELKKGYTFYFKNKTWKVTEIYKIKWRDGTKSNEYKVKSDKGIIKYLEIELDKNKKATYSFWTKETNKEFLYESQKLVTDYIPLGKAKFPKTIDYKGVVYEFDERNDGICHYSYETEKVNSLDYINSNDTKLLSIELWDDEIEVSTGYPIKKEHISRIKEGKLSIFGEDSPVVNWIYKYIAFILMGMFFLFSFTLNKCNRSNNSWNDNTRYSNDSTKVYRSNSYYRNRNSRGYGK